MQIRIAVRDDLARIVAIYNQAVIKGNCTADTEPLNIQEREGWFSEHNPEQYPIYIATGDARQQVIGWCSLTAHRKGRKALARVAEISYYVDENEQSKGVGTQLISHAIEQAPLLGLHNLFAILLDTNTTSVAILERFGFKRWGHLPEIAEFNDRICGQFIYGRKV